MDISTFVPCVGLKNAHLQTIYPALFRKQDSLELSKEIFELYDGDFVECHWCGKDEASTKPIVILFHGLEGSSSSSYIRGMMKKLFLNGYVSVVMHFRGCSGVQNRLPKCYHSGETEDAKAWISHLRDRYPDTKLFAIGYSLGGNMLLKLLAEYADNKVLEKAVSVSAPMDLEACAVRLNTGVSKLYQKHLMRFLKNSLLEKYQQHDMKKYIGIDEEGVKKLKTFWEFDDVYTAPIHGMKTAKNYYKICSAKPYLKKIQTPTLIINAKDDPFMLPRVLPTKEELSSTIVLEVPEHGGHVGFVGGTLAKPTFWLEDRVIRFFSS